MLGGDDDDKSFVIATTTGTMMKSVCDCCINHTFHLDDLGVELEIVSFG